MSHIKPKFKFFFFLLSRNEVMFVVGPQTVKPFGSSLKLLLAGHGVQRLFTSSTQGKDVQVFPFPGPGENVQRKHFLSSLKCSGLVRCQKSSPNNVPRGSNMSIGEDVLS